MTSKDDKIRKIENQNDEEIIEGQSNTNDSREDIKRTFFTGLP